MKAKSWKSFLQDPDTEAEPLNDDAPDGGADLFDPALLSSVAESNPELESLLAQRDALEQEMARLTGNAPAADAGPRALGEIPAMRERKRTDAEWAQKRQQQVEDYIRKRKEKSVDEPPLRDLDALPVDNPLTGFEKKLKAEKERFSQVREDLTSLSERSLSTSGEEFPPLRDLDKKTAKKKPEDSYDPVGKTWEQLHEAKRKANSVKDAFDKKLDEAMDLDKNVDFDEKQAEIKEKALEKLEEKKAEEKQEAKEKEKREQEKQEGPEAEEKKREKREKKQREKQVASKKEKKEQDKREARKKERMQKRKEEEEASNRSAGDEDAKREKQKEKRKAEKQAERKQARREERRQEKKREQKRERKRNRFDI